VPIAFRIVDQLFNHLASPSEELRKSSGFARVKSAVPAVQTKYAAEIASRAWAWRCRVKKKNTHGVCASGQPHPQRPPNYNAPLRLEIGQIAGGLERALRCSRSAIGRF
jgi:hypothetical protein